MTKEQRECVRRVRALVFFADQEEVPFLEETVPLWLKLYSEADVFLYFPRHYFFDFNANTFVRDSSQNHRVHVLTSKCSKTASGVPVGSDSVLSVLESVMGAASSVEACPEDFIMRVLPYTIPMRTEYIAQGIEQGATFISSNGGSVPFAMAPYLMTAELWHRVMRIVSLMNVVGLSKGFSDIYIQSMVFAVAHAEKFMYVHTTNPVGSVMRHVFDYDKAENDSEYIKSVIPLAGCIDMRPTANCDMKKLMRWTRKLSTLVLTYNAAS